MARLRLALALSLITTVWLGCDSESAQTSGCTPGTYMDCTTDDGKSGLMRCEAGTWGTCVASGSCADGTKQACTTPCGAGEEVCIGGVWQNCTAPQTQQETCDGIDNNCDGQIDEVCLCVHGTIESCYSGGTATRSTGKCKDGQRSCTNGTWGPCLGEVLPDIGETCGNGLDDDCNGTAEDGCTCTPGSVQDCGTDVGACETGVQSCTTGAVWGPCNGGKQPMPEEPLGCNGIDDDCDGVVDNGLAPDGGEANDTCLQARRMEITDVDEAPTTLEWSIYPENDIDYIQLTVKEEGTDLCCFYPICTTPEPECNYLTIELNQPDDVEGVRYQFTVLTSDCAHPGPTYSDEETLTLQWPGACGSNDSQTVWIKVQPTSSAAVTYTCKPYDLVLWYENRVETCPGT